MFSLASRVFSQFSTILRLAGSESLTGIQEEAVPVWDLNRVLQADRVDHVVYSVEDTPAATGNVDANWNDASDWTEVQVNGIVTTSDADLPPVTNDRLLLAITLQITGTVAQYTAGQAARQNPFASATLSLAGQWGTNLTDGVAVLQTAPYILPQILMPGENLIRFREIVTGVAAEFHWTAHLLSAAPGVMARFPGV